MAYASCGACRSSSVALAGSVITSPFICERMSSSWSGGSVDSVREMASGHVRLGGNSTPGGRGPSVLDGCAGGGTAAGWPFMPMGACVFGSRLEGALSPEPLSLDQSTLSLRPMRS